MRIAVLVCIVAWVTKAYAGPVISAFDVSGLDCAPTTQRAVQQALEDFEAVLSYRDLIHAKRLNPDMIVFDGGTTFWRGEGYELEVRKRLCGIGKLKHFLYGPVVTFDEETLRGGDDGGRSISNVRIYGYDELNDKLRAKIKAAEPGATDNPDGAQ